MSVKFSRLSCVSGYLWPCVFVSSVSHSISLSLSRYLYVYCAGLELPPDLEMGDWRYLSAQEVEALRVK
jgi:hypothetical protein